MPALKIIGSFTTRPFASDDIYVVCFVLGLYRAIQFICLATLVIQLYLQIVKGDGLFVNGVPPWCSQFRGYGDFAFEDGGGVLATFEDILNLDYTHYNVYIAFLSNACAYLFVDVAWIIMVCHSASIGTPTESLRRDKYIRNLIRFKIFVSNLYPLALVGHGVYYVYGMRSNNYGCGDDGHPVARRDGGAYYGMLCTLLVTYALELLVWPMILTNKVVRSIKRVRGRARVEGRHGKAERFERNLGLVLKAISCLTRGRAGGADLRNKGELKDFASHVMCLLNNQTKLDLVLSDIYVGMRMLSLVQAEKKVDAIRRMTTANTLLPSNGGEGDSDGDQRGLIKSQSLDQTWGDEKGTGRKMERRATITVLHMKRDSYEVCERRILQGTNASDKAALLGGGQFVKYAAKIYIDLPNCVLDEFVGAEEECSVFARGTDTLFRDEFRLTSIGCEHTMLCYATFVNGIVETPYAIMVDLELEKVVISIRGTKSLEDLVIDVQFIPQSLEKVGKVCGFNGEGHFCHKGFLARSKWMYNDIKKTQVLRTLYSEQSPFKDYPLVLCGHSLGAGCASILSLMLRPSFPGLRCFAYEPPGCIFDDELSSYCEEFIVAFVRHDDLVPRLSYHNFETLRESFFDAFMRIKVPKIDLFFHWRKPYSDKLLAVHNAEVLRPEGKTSPCLLFNEQLAKLRDERATKNLRGVNRVQLFIPGKIVHLVDTNGDGNYIPYWAQRDEFDQLEISKRMYADHDILSLVDILNDAALGQAKTMSNSIHNSPLAQADGEELNEEDVRLFACCPNPYGKMPYILSFLGAVASSISGLGGADCEFVNVALPETSDTFNGTLVVSFGLYAFKINECENSTGPTCNLLDELNQVCVQYPPNFHIDGYMSASRIFLGLLMIFGSIAIPMIWISMCFIFNQRTWGVVTVLLLLASLFEGLIFIIVRGFDFCSEPQFSCKNGASAVKSGLACCIWFIMAVGSGYLAKVGKKNKTDGQLEHGDQPNQHT